MSRREANRSPNTALSLCSNDLLSFVWGPPTCWAAGIIIANKQGGFLNASTCMCHVKLNHGGNAH